MYQLIRNRTVRTFLIDTAPALVVSFLVAEFFYKWHSFTLECAGFLGTWFVLDWLWTTGQARVRARRPTST
jgi:hypothetical protein